MLDTPQSRPFAYAVALVILGLAGCGHAAGTRPFAIHAPMHPAAHEPVTIAATAQGGRVASLAIWEQRNVLRSCADGTACATLESEQAVKTCTFDKPVATADCTATIPEGYPDGYLIGYRAVVNGGQPGRSSDPWTYFASGAFPWPDQPVPVFVHAPPEKAIDVVVMADAALREDLAAFRAETTKLIKDSLFGGVPAAEALRDEPASWNVYVSYAPAERAPRAACAVPPDIWPRLRGVANVGIVLSPALEAPCIELGEGALIALGTSAGPMAVHALSHAVFNLADEYCCNGAYWEIDREPNIFQTRTACRAHASSHDWPSTACVEISPPSWWRTAGKSGWYRSDPAGDLMAEPASLTARHGRADRARIRVIYDRCREGRC